MKHLSVLLGILLLGVIAFNINFWHHAGLILLLAVLIIIIIRHHIVVYQFKNWAKGSLYHQPPELPTLYSELIQTIYTKSKALHHTLQKTIQLNDSIVSAAEVLPEAAVLMNKHFQIQWYNKTASELLGLNPHQDTGQNLLNLLRHPEFHRYVNSGNWEHSIQLNISHQTHKTLQIQLLRNGDKGILLLGEDITEIKRLRSLQQNLVANVSHELRTPLTVLIGFLETLQELPISAISDEQRKHYETLMHQQAQRMLAIVSDLLTLSVLESSALPECEPCHFSQVIQHIAKQAIELSKEKHEFIFNLDDTLYVMGKQSELSSVVSNLLSNAVRYTPEKGKIITSWYQNESGEGVFCVQDTGIGIDAKDIPKITERFYRVDKSRSRASGGTGLGLAITKHIVLRHHAKLIIESTPNKGSTFNIIFPSNMMVRHEHMDNNG
ncbi:phosphate regulon sensor histidine kinase PhoR [Basilea psittacipulmonis]|uniref:Phosphate regulon sensor protein PhoR n=1 Tax=Basilea psittacipulmonis DSM 24701 TaxID=1072685 RepID=A0A077DD88_9BURK|nr:phosphate regulon sensor histidine kinase PhoR [Basilea psittacipulmonis]AIL32136.1 hypothetical protein IX83_01285 [Basilea psittacipulmonis DSM 24701]